MVLAQHVSYVCKSLLKYFGIFNKIRHIVSPRISRQLYYAFIYSRIAYGIEAYGNCSQNYLQKIQVIQSKLLKLLLCKDPRYSTNDLHKNMHILKVKDIHNANVICFVKNCLVKNVPNPFHNYFTRSDRPYATRTMGLDISRFRTRLGSFAIKISGAKLWNELPVDITDRKEQVNFRKILINYLINEYIDNA